MTKVPVQILSEESAADAAVGLVVRCTTRRSCTYLDFVSDDGMRTLRFDTLPDSEAALAWTATMRHVTSVRFDASPAGISCSLRGIGHRAPRTAPLPAAAALGIVRQGLVGLVVQQAGC